MEMNAHYKQTIDFTDELASLIDPAEYFPHPPSSYHFAATNTASAPRHTPSPQQQQHQPYHHQQHHQPHQHQQQRSRSRSRPPSSNEGCPTTSAGSIGPARRSRRNNSVSGTSPPPPYARPHAIVIPATRGGNGNGWFSQSSASEFSLPTPSSEMGQHQYTPFALGDQQKVDFSLSAGYQQMHPQNSPTSYQHPYSPSSVPVSLAIAAAPPPPHHPPQHPNGPPPPSNPHHHHHGPGSLAGALSSSLPITQTPSSALGPSTLSGAFGISPGGIPVPPPGLASSFSVTVGLNAPPSNSPTSPTTTSAPTTTAALQTASLSPQDKQALIANEKRRRRRESHNAVERRRRDNINEKISELATLIPECMLEGGPANAPTGSVSPSTEAAHFVDGNDPMLPTSMSISVAMKKEDGIKEEGDGPGVTSPPGASEGGIVKANKGMILRKSVEYIRYLQQLVTAQGARNRELEQELKAYRSGSAHSTGSPTSSSSSGVPSGSAPRGGIESSSTINLKRKNSSGRHHHHHHHSHGGGPVRTPSDTSGEEGDRDHEHDESSDPEGDYDDGHHNSVVGGGMGYGDMGMVLAEEALRLDFVDSPIIGGPSPPPTAAAPPPPPTTTNVGPRGRRIVRGRRASTNDHSSTNNNNNRTSASNSNGGMTTTINLPMGLQSLDMLHDSMDMEVDGTNGGSEEGLRGRTSTRMLSGNNNNGNGDGQKRAAMVVGVNGHLTTSNGVIHHHPHHLKEEVDVVVDELGMAGVRNGHGHVGMVHHGHGLGHVVGVVGMGLGMQS